jgi:aminopeptidase N
VQVTVRTTYSAAERTLTLHAKQQTPPTPGQDSKLPVLIPLAVGLLGPDGKDLPLHLQVRRCPLP